jgi:hypothetical protein
MSILHLNLTHIKIKSIFNTWQHLIKNLITYSNLTFKKLDLSFYNIYKNQIYG